MTKILRYLKPHLLSLFFAVLLICCTVAGDLSLPTLMSNIVSVGIQQSGIEDAAPKAISQDGFRLMTDLMEPDDQQLAKHSYTLITAAPDDSRVSQYPLLATEDLYVQNSVTGEQQTQLNEAFSTATLTLSAFGKELAAQKGQDTANSDAAESDQSGLSLDALYQLLPMLEQLPAEKLHALQETAKQEQSLMADQSGVALAKQFYQEIGADTDGMQMGYIIRIGAIMIALTLLSGIATVLVSLLSSRIAAGVARALRQDVFRKVTSFSNEEFDHFSTASLITRTTNDITQVQMVLTMGIRIAVQAPATGIGGIVLALQKSVSMGWIVALSVICLLCLVGVIFVLAMPKFTKLQKLIDRMNLVARENLSGIMVIRAFDNEEFEKDRYDTANKNLAHTQLFVNRLMVVMMPIMMLIMNLTSLAIVWVGAHQIAQSAMQIGDMMAFMQYSMQIIMAFLMIAMMFILVPRAAVSANRIREVLETTPAIEDPKTPVSLDETKAGLVEFRDVSFRYGDADDAVLSHITFTAQPGKTTAFIGSTGSGKSTLINLIPRFYDCTEGQVLVNGVDVRNVPQHELRAHIGYVPQKGILHKGTIASNIAYGKPDATREELESAAQVAQAMDFISKKEKGMDSEIAAGGTNVSGGQKQRISIARALAVKPDIYIFDDSFSALDFKTDAALRHALKDYTNNATVLIVAQRVGTILNADQIIVLDEGRIVGKGTHKELLKTCPVYYEIAASQLTKEEMA
ncbi:MAG: ABC transporter ATP-binding protein [Oscillospiraceae bacterium]|nr:ABC transporter ATP-binding protein [Oscillospiraceae bacterium]